ncbi:hypothetical protein [Altererythrobacter sp.]|uniref:hypothetical protein n=1 Tax=Altererythrobacter sp. TaxID=1872480 RepID=UPI001B1EDAE1|nr:hypothetical protein [Altererythrobacter sp.]MBO6944113.1 hypothetical protein [Altererythrobacter sp.]
MIRAAVMVTLLASAAACKPPPTDAGLVAGDVAASQGPSEPIDSPDTEGAVWSDSPITRGRIIYGIPGEPPLLALGCGDMGDQPSILITRYAPADKDAEGVAALIGNGHVARIPVTAIEIDGGSYWRAEISAFSEELEVLTGTRELAVTIPGGGRLVLNPSHRTGEFIEDCRASPSV